MKHFRLNRCAKRNLRVQAGFMLLELMLTLAVVSALGIMGLARQVEELGDARMVAQGKALMTLQAAQNTYITTYYNELLNGLPVPLPLPLGGNVVDPMNPTIPELIALNIGLPGSFSNTAFNGGNYQVRITNNAGQLEAEAWVTQPFLASNGTPDLPRLGVATQTIGPDAGFSSAVAPGMYRTRSSAIDLINPAGAVPGILIARSGFNTLSMLAYLRRDGTLPMTGDLRMGNQDINDVTNINADGQITASDVVSTTGSIDTLTSNSITTNTLAANTGTITNLTTSGINNTGAYTGAGLIRTTGNVEAADVIATGLVQSGSITTGSLNAAGNLNVSGTATMASQTITGNQTVEGNTVVQGALFLGTIANDGAFCGANPGAIARDASNNLFICN